MQSPRMTRDAYFKIVENQNLSTMRDEMLSIMNGATTDNNDNTVTTRRSGFGLSKRTSLGV